MTNISAEAKLLGIPLTIPMDDHIRYSFCAADEADLISIEGDQAMYKGVCNCGHIYNIRLSVQELRKHQEVKVENGEIVLGDGDDYIATNLEEY